MGIRAQHRVTAEFLMPGDLDEDRDVDHKDFGLFQACLTGTSAMQNGPTRARGLLDRDENLDQADMILFLGCMSGANTPFDPYCSQRVVPNCTN